MRGLADERDAARREALRGLDAERKQAAAVFDRHLAEDRMRAPLDLGRQRGAHRARASCSASAGSTTQTRLERRPGRGTSVNGPVSVWNSVEMPLCGRAWPKLSVSAACG